MNLLAEIIFQTLIIVIYSGIFIVLGGKIIGYLEKKSNLYLYLSFGYAGTVLTGIGTIVHELSHLICVIVTFMKPVEVKLFRPLKAKEDGRLGYVEYSYNKKNYFHRLAVILVGIAPMIGGTIGILIALKLCVPSANSFLIGKISYLISEGDLFSLNFLKTELRIMLDFIFNLFSINNLKSIKFWIFLFISISIASHMSLSKADMREARKGIPILFVFVFIINLILGIIGVSFDSIIDFLTAFNMYIVIFISISILFATINVVITYLISRILHRNV